MFFTIIFLLFLHFYNLTECGITSGSTLLAYNNIIEKRNENEKLADASINEMSREKTNVLYVRKQRRRSASWLPRS